jgi:hypothetical protein
MVESARIARRVEFTFLAATAAYLYFRLFTFAGIPIYLAGDHHIFLEEARRILDGQIPYRDFLPPLPPTTGYTYAALLKLIGLKFWVHNALLLAIGVTLTWLTLRISRAVLPGRWAFAPPLLFVTLGFNSVLAGTHHWFSVLASVAALALTVQSRSTRRLWIAGALCGIASAFTPTRGAVCCAAIAAFVIWEDVRSGTRPTNTGYRLMALIMGAALALFLLLLPVALLAGPVSVAKGYVSFLRPGALGLAQYDSWHAYMVGLPPLNGIRSFLPGVATIIVHLTLPLAYVLFFVRYWQSGERNRASRPVMLVAVFGFADFCGVAPAPAFTRLAVETIPAFVVLVWWLCNSGRIGRSIALALCAFASVYGLLGAARPGGWKGILELPAGPIAFLDPDHFEEYRWLANHTRPGDLFFNARYSEYSFPLLLRNPAPVAYVTNSAATPGSTVDGVVAAFERHHPKYIVWNPELDVAYGLTSDTTHLQILRSFIVRNYDKVKVFQSGDEVWQERSTISASAVPGLAPAEHR